MFQVKKLLVALSVIGVIGFAGIAFAAPYFGSTRSMVPESDTVNNNLGTTSPSNLRYNGFFKDVSISGTCTGCGSGSAPAFTPTSWGASTTTVLGFINGFISNASSTFPYLGTGGVGVNNGRLYNYATTTFSSGLTYSGGNVTNTGVTSIVAGTNITISGATGAVTVNSTGGGGNIIATTTNIGISKLAFFSGVTPTVLDGVATTTLTATAPISLSNIISVIGATPSVLACAVASGSLAGCLSSADWTTFNNKQATISTTYPVTLTGATVGLAFGTTTANTWSGLNIFNATTTLAGGFIGGDTTTGLFYDATSGRLSLGAKDNTHIISGVTYGEKIAVHIEGATDGAGVSLHRHSDIIGFGSHLLFSRSRGTEAAEGAVVNGDFLGRLDFIGHDGTDYEIGAQIDAVVDGVVGSNDIPTMLKFWTTPDGSATPLERLTIKSTGNIGIGSTTPYAKLSVTGAGSTTGVNFQTTNSSNSPLFTILDSGNVGIATSSPAFRFSVNDTGSAFYIDSNGKVVARDTTNGWDGRLSPTRRPGFVIATSTGTWTATSTPGRDISPEKVIDYAGTMRTVTCKLNTFLGVTIYINTTKVTPTYFIASSTSGIITFTANNTFAKGDYIWAEAGTTTSATAASGSVRGSCTLNNTETP